MTALTALRCRTVPIPPEVWATHPARTHADVVFERDGYGLAGRGVAARVPADSITDALSAIEVDDAVGRPGSGPVGFAALPFAGAGSFVLPAQLVGIDASGTAWQTEIGGGPLPEPRTWGPEPDGFILRSAVPHDDWQAAVATVVDRIERNEVHKVVLAREVTVECDRPIVVPTVLRRLRALFPSCTTFLVDGFVGASPEVLVQRTGDTVVSYPLAGTRPRSGDPDDDRRVGEEMLASEKDRVEHDLVVQAVAAELRHVCVDLEVPVGPSVVPLRNVLHLGTRIRGRLWGPAPTAYELARRLHPTPAVGGTPSDAALRILAELEPSQGRGCYAGPVGWVDRRGDGEFVVGIRAAQVDGARASLWAGVGIVSGSDPEAELAETQFKLQTMLAAIVRP